MIRSTKDLLQHARGTAVASNSSASSSRRADDPAQAPPTLRQVVVAPPPLASNTNTNPILRQLANDAVSPAMMTTSASDGAAAPPTAAVIRRRSDAAADSQAEELRRRLEMQKMELDNRTDSVNAIQRNFARLSDMYGADRQKLVEAEAEIARLSEEVTSLRSSAKLFAALRLEFTSLSTEHEKLKQQLDAERAQAQAQLKKVEEHCKVLERDNKGMSSSLNKIARDLQTRAADEERMAHVLVDAETSWNAVLLSCMDWQKEMSSVVAQSRAEVGKGIALVSSADCRSSSAGVEIEDGHPLRLEVLAKSMQACTEEAIPALRRLCDARVADVSDQLDKTHYRLQQQELDSTLMQRTLNEKLEQLANRLEDAQAGAKSLIKLHEAEKSQLNTLVADLRLQLSNAKSDADAELAAVAATQAMQQRVAALERELQHARVALTNQSEEANAARKSAEDALSRASRDAATRLDAAREQLALRETQLSQEKHARGLAEQSTRALADQQKRLQQEILALRAQMEQDMSSRNSAESSRIQSLEKELQAAKADAAVSESSRRTTQEQLDSACETVRDWQAKYELLVSERSREREQLLASEARANAAEVRIAELMAERSQLLMNASHHEDALEDANAQLAQLKSQFAKWQAEKAVLEVDIARLREDLSRAASGNAAQDALKLRLKQMQDECSDLKSALLNASALSQVHQEKISQLSQSLAAAERDAAEAKRLADAILGTQASIDAQRSALEKQRAAAEGRMRHLRQVQEETLKTVRKLHNVEKACESGYSCQGCLQLVKDPVTCAPCGHVFCRKCFESDPHNREKKSKGTFCPECDEANVAMVVGNKALDLLTGKFEYRCQVLSDLTAMLEKDVLRPETPVNEK